MTSSSQQIVWRFTRPPNDSHAWRADHDRGGRPRQHGGGQHALLANAGHGLGRAFLDQDFAEVRRVIEANITGTVYLVPLLGCQMRERGQGHILLTGLIAGFMPGTYHAVYDGTKAFVDSFSLPCAPS